MEKIGTMPKKADISKAVEYDEDSLTHKPRQDFATILNPELPTAMRAEVRSPVTTAKKEVLLTNVEETLRYVFLDGYEEVEKGVQDSPYRF